jgi:hypothetical protein
VSIHTFDRLPHELQGLLDPLVRRGIDGRRFAAGGSLSVMASIAPGANDDLDLLVTVHDERGRSFERVWLGLTDSRGSVVRAMFTSRGQAFVPGVGPAPWVVRVARHPFGADALPCLEINRRLPLAAAFGVRELEYVVGDTAGRVGVTLQEDDEEHLQLSISGTLRVDELTRIRWTATRRHEDLTNTLVTPVLGRAADDVVGYDLGPLAGASTVHVYPLEIIDARQLTESDVASTVACTWRGSARRAWRQWLADNPVEPAIQTVLDPLVG